MDLICSRVGARRHEYMPESLLQTQFDDLEGRQGDETGLTVDIAQTPEQIVDQVVAVLAGGAARFDRQN
jgi:gluconokinase